MKWAEYPTRRDFEKWGENGNGGTWRTGRVWADGPARGSKWVIPADAPDRKPVLVRMFRGVAYRILSE